MRVYIALITAVIFVILIGPTGSIEQVFADEAELIFFAGDVDNLGFNFPIGFDVFSGSSTPVHPYPFEPESSDAQGTDRIMVGSSYDGNPPNGIDGYTSTTSRSDNEPESIEMIYDLGTVSVNSAIIQIFVDDFQSPVYNSRFQVLLNDKRAVFIEDALNILNQTGPIGKLISLPVPSQFLSDVSNEYLTIAIDDPTTGAGDGYAIDFVRLLVNPNLLTNVGTIVGTIISKENGTPLVGVTVSAGGTFSAVTDADGDYILSDIPAGLAILTASKLGYISQTATVDLLSGGTATLNFELAVDAAVPSGPIDLQDLFNAGVNLGWAHIHSFWRVLEPTTLPILNPPDGPTIETGIIAHLNRLQDSLTTSGFPFVNYISPIDNMIASIQSGDDSLYVPTECARLLSDLQDQLGSAGCEIITGETIWFLELFGAGVNLGWAHIHSFWRVFGSPPILNPPDGPTTNTGVIAHLNRLKNALPASGFPFINYEDPIDDMIASIQSGDDSLYVPTECARLLTELQAQLGDITCQGSSSGNLLIVTSEDRLTDKFGQQGYIQIANAWTSLNPTILNITSSDFTAIDDRIEELGMSNIGTILIVGGHDIVPFSEMSNPTSDQDTNLLTDDIYADFNHDAEQIIDVPIARIPDGGDLDLLLTQLTPNSSTGTGGFSLANCNRQWADKVAKIINASPSWSAPTRPDDIPPTATQVPFAYIMLHGSGNQGARWFGELGPPTDWEAFEAFNTSNASSQGVVLSGACYGAMVVNYTPENSICLAFLKSGTQAFVGATAINYTYRPDGSNRLSGLFHRLFFENLSSGDTPLMAFFNAKRTFGNSVSSPAGRKNSHIFVYYGRP